MKEYSDRREKTWKMRDANLELFAQQRSSPQNLQEDLKLAKKVTSTHTRFDMYQKHQITDLNFEVQQFENNGLRFKN